MGKHKLDSELNDLYAKVDADARPRAQKFAENMWELDDFVDSFTEYLRETLESAYGKGSQIHIEDATSHTWAAAENLFYAISNFRK